MFVPESHDANLVRETEALWQEFFYHPWTNGLAERMNRTIKEATTKVFHYPDLESLKAHVLAFITAYNFSKHLKALRWKTPFEAVCDEWTKNPTIFKINPRHLIPGPYN